jgi:hypothetical protein
MWNVEGTVVETLDGVRITLDSRQWVSALEGTAVETLDSVRITLDSRQLYMRKSEHLLHTGHESTDVADSGG